ncbi:MAG: inositol-3-phosphate synthase, partial [Candidatus Bathyarchaeia archaeon]
MGEIRVAIVGVGNCASALVQGVHYYRDIKDECLIPGLLHADFGGYRVGDVRFVAAFDVDERKVGKDLGEAIYSKPNNTPVFIQVPSLGVTVMKGRVLDSIGKFLKPVIKVDSENDPADVVGVLREAEADMVLNYLPVGSEEAAQWYAQQAVEAGCAFVICMATF